MIKTVIYCQLDNNRNLEMYYSIIEKVIIPLKRISREKRRRRSREMIVRKWRIL